MNRERLDALALHACYPPGIPMPSGSSEHIKAAVIQAVREALDAAVNKINAEDDPHDPMTSFWCSDCIRRLRDELAPP